MAVFLRVCLCFLAVQALTDAEEDDTGLPTPQFVITPSRVTKDLFPELTFYAADTDLNYTEYRCTHTKPDGTSSTFNCSSSVILGGTTGLEQGPHQLEVQTQNRTLRLTGADKASYVFIVDKTYPHVVMDSHSSNGNNTVARNITFMFHPVGRRILIDSTATGGVRLDKEDPCLDCQLYCQIDSLPVTSCASPTTYNELGTPGQVTTHRFRIRAIDNAMYFSSITAYTWNIDLAPPNMSFVQLPQGIIERPDATFQVATTEPAATKPRFECTLNNGTRFSCMTEIAASPGTYEWTLRNLTIGNNYSFTIYAIDALGNEDAGKTSTFYVRTTTPVVTFQPDSWAEQGGQSSGSVLQNGSLTDVATATFWFVVKSGHKAECKLDSSQWQDCTLGSFTTRNLASGTHTFRVRAKNLFGMFTPEADQPFWTWTLAGCPLPVAPTNGQLLRKSTFSDQDSWQISCNSGYSLNGPKSVTCNNGATSSISNSKCSDADECAIGQHSCARTAMCQNTVGSYRCTCGLGYSGDGKTCTDIDECAGNQSLCDPQATCGNTAGSFSCTCDSGYVGDGRNCTVEIPATGGLQGSTIGMIVGGVVVLFLLVGVALFFARSAELDIGSLGRGVKAKLPGMSGGFAVSFNTGSGAPSAAAHSAVMKRHSIVSTTSIVPMQPPANVTSDGEASNYADVEAPTMRKVEEGDSSIYDTVTT